MTKPDKQPETPQEEKSEITEKNSENNEKKSEKTEKNSENSEKDSENTEKESGKTEEKKTPFKSYLMPGMMECMVELRTGTSLVPTVRVNFSGGQITGYGVTPARYTTADRGIQNLIEASPMFKSGRIYCIIHNED